MTGFLPQDILGSAVFEYFKEDDSSHIRELLKLCSQTNEKLVSSLLKMRTVESGHICVRAVCSSFTNPFTSELEHILLNVTAIPSYTESTPYLGSTPAPTDQPREPTSPCTTRTDDSGQSRSRLMSGEEEEEISLEASKAIMMSFLEADGGLGGQIENQNLSWLCGASKQS